MKMTLWIIFGLSVFWFGQAISEPKVKSMASLDAIILPRVMDLTTPHERVLMSEALEKVITTNHSASLGAIMMGLVSACGLGISALQDRRLARADPISNQKSQI